MIIDCVLDFAAGEVGRNDRVSRNPEAPGSVDIVQVDRFL